MQQSFQDYGDRNFDENFRRALSDGYRLLTVKEILDLREQALSRPELLGPPRGRSSDDVSVWTWSHMTGDCIAHHRGQIKVIPNGMAQIVGHEHLRIRRGDYLLPSGSDYSQLPGPEFEFGFDHAKYELGEHPIVRSVWHTLGIDDEQLSWHRALLAQCGFSDRMGMMFAQYWQQDSEDASPIVRPLRVCAAQYGTFLDNMYPCDSVDPEVPDNHIMAVP